MYENLDIRDGHFYQLSVLTDIMALNKSIVCNRSSIHRRTNYKVQIWNLEWYIYLAPS